MKTRKGARRLRRVESFVTEDVYRAILKRRAGRGLISVSAYLRQLILEDTRTGT